MRRFRNIIMIIIVSIFALFVFNLFYLKGLFYSIKTDTERVISACIEEADSKEMQIRMDILSRYHSDNHSIMIDKSFSTDSVSETSILQTTTRSMINNNDTAIEVRLETLDLNLAAFSQLLHEIRSILHHNIDVVLPVDLHKFDSLLIIELKNKSIYSDVYYSEIIDEETGTVLQTSREESSVELIGNYPQLYTYDQEYNRAYRVYIVSITNIVFKQMSGVLISTFLIIVLLCIAFWYLIRTVIQQKTLEEMKDDFTNNMTHELKTPIAVAYSAADTLLNFRQGENREKRKRYLQVCTDQLSHLSGLVEQILSMSMERRKTITINANYIELKTVIGQIIDLHKLKANKEVTFNVHITPENMVIYADSVHLNNIISNLLDNAIKYSENKAVIEITAYNDKAFSVLAVKDHGIGIAPNNIEHVFDKFYRVPSRNIHNVKGYGLGLFYVKQIVEKHNGSISVKSFVNKGSVFTIKLPLK